jgi:hypothetical protein
MNLHDVMSLACLQGGRETGSEYEPTQAESSSAAADIVIDNEVIGVLEHLGFDVLDIKQSLTAAQTSTATSSQYRRIYALFYDKIKRVGRLEDLPWPSPRSFDSESSDDLTSRLKRSASATQSVACIFSPPRSLVSSPSQVRRVRRVRLNEIVPERDHGIQRRRRPRQYVPKIATAVFEKGTNVCFASYFISPNRLCNAADEIQVVRSISPSPRDFSSMKLASPSVGPSPPSASPFRQRAPSLPKRSWLASLLSSNPVEAPCQGYLQPQGACPATSCQVTSG